MASPAVLLLAAFSPERIQLERNLDLGMTASRRRSHGRSDSIGMLPDVGPPCAAGQNDEGNAVYFQVLR